ncbi:unnamed protein product [Brachionus calyciflorus]|uniref:Uncharacterized protein n=1 Tax=Brachionus calyciflorus TaxID=104777 RepID=A0A813Z008_9BILA|nr:unnamed protein product [Brachionus calyciflorus]
MDAKNKLNRLRITFGKYVLQKLKIDKEMTFAKRNRVRTIGYDIWNLINSLEEDKLIECNDMFKKNNKVNDSMNLTQSENEVKQDVNS